MDERRYDILYAGELAAGAELESVKSRLAALFKTDVRGIARLFSGETIVIKRGLDEETAYRYRDTMQRAGAVCRIRPVTSSSPTEAPAGSLASATVLPPGSLLPQPPMVAAPEFNLDGLTMAPPGITLIDGVAVRPVRLPDVSGITLAPPGERLLPELSAPKALSLPDISGITLAPLGTDLLRPDELAPVAMAPAAGAFELV